MPFFRDSQLTFLLSTAVLLITTTAFFAFSISLHSAYLWLAVVFVTLIFMATFTCTYNLPGYFVQEVQNNASIVNPISASTGEINFAVEAETEVPYWITVDLPPDYDMIAGVLPPSYSKATGIMINSNSIESDNPSGFELKPDNCEGT